MLLGTQAVVLSKAIYGSKKKGPYVTAWAISAGALAKPAVSVGTLKRQFNAV